MSLRAKFPVFFEHCNTSDWIGKLIAATVLGTGVLTLVPSLSAQETTRSGSCYRPIPSTIYTCNFGPYNNLSRVTYTNGSGSVVKILNAQGQEVQRGTIDASQREFLVQGNPSDVKVKLEPNNSNATTYFSVSLVSPPPPTPSPSPTPSSCPNIVLSNNQNKTYSTGQKWVCNGYRFEFQTDGNLVLYRSSGEVLWAAGTEGRAKQLKVQNDGNVVLYDQNAKPLWATNTNGNADAYFSIQADGNLVVYRKDGVPIWASGTDGGRKQTISASAKWLDEQNPRPGAIAVQRAKVWVDRKIPYDQGLTANPDGSRAARNAGYRTDCSGLVSMAWNLPAKGLDVPNTVYLSRYANTLGSKDELQPGDAINNRQWGNYGHVVLFVRWIDKAKGTFVAYEENGGRGSVETNLTLVWKNGQWDIPNYPNRNPWFLERKK
jgi:hypothetical protein